MASSKEATCSFEKEMEFEVQHFDANYEQLERMVRNTVKDPNEQDRLLNVAARLTL